MLALLFSLALAWPSPVAGQQPPSSARDPIELLANWVRRFQRGTDLPDLDALNEVRELVGDVRMLTVVDAARRHEAAVVLLDLASFAPRQTETLRGRRREAPGSRANASELGFEALEHAFDVDGAASATWLATEVLAQPATQPLARRRAALELLRGHRLPDTLSAVMSCARDKERELRDAAMATLEGWDDDGVHRFMLRQLDQNRAQVDWVSSLVVYRHFARVKLDPESGAACAVRDWAQRETTSEDWRRAVAGVRVLNTLDDRLAVPVLVESLSLWLDRRALDDARRRPDVEGGPERNTPGHGSRRVEGDIERCLKAHSGRNLGLNPDRWARWWRSTAGNPADPQDMSAVTRVNFFGLHPWTDRVVLVLDHSGSMSHAWSDGDGGTSRYAEVLRQMRVLLRELGPQTRFRVILFSSEPSAWRDKLEAASEGSVDAAVQWAGYNPPDGGTGLRAAIEQVFRLDRKGEPDLKRIEEDTVIVLCDGETSDGPNWVEPVLERVNSQANLVFHCVQIGGAGDGALERLASATGGEFLHVDG